MTTGFDDDRPVEILLVEDSPSDANLAIVALQEGSLRYRVHHVEDGADAMAFLRREGAYSAAPRPDLILLDLNLPKMDGYQVLAEIQADGRFGEIPAIVLTASADPHDIQESYSLGASFYITKPADLHEFITTMTGVKAAIAALRRLGVNIDRFLSNRVGNLDLTSTRIQDDALAHLRNLTQMKRLWLGHTAVSDAGLALLSPLRHLVLLDLEATHVTDAGLSHLAELTELEELNLADLPITDAGLKQLTPLQQLRRLNLRSTAISDAAIPCLSQLPHLEYLDLSQTRVTANGPQQLRAALPQATISGNN